jgi:hypothetical protein
MTGPNMTGNRTFYGKPVKDGQAGNGQIEMPLRQHGVDLTGQIVQTLDPWTQAPPHDPEATHASVIGKVYVSESQPATLVELVRLNHYSDFKAIFTGILSEDERDVSGQGVNSQGALGTFTMHKISD